jgi:hypothetical protein
VQTLLRRLRRRHLLGSMRRIWTRGTSQMNEPAKTKPHRHRVLHGFVLAALAVFGMSVAQCGNAARPWSTSSLGGGDNSGSGAGDGDGDADAGSGGSGGASEEPKVDATGCSTGRMLWTSSTYWYPTAFFAYLLADTSTDTIGLLEVSLYPPELGKFDLSSPTNRRSETCSECIRFTEYLPDGPARTYVAQEGWLEMVDLPTTEGGPSSGIFDQLLLREANVNLENGTATLVEDGACVFFNFDGWSSERCDPGEDCADGYQCWPSLHATSGQCNRVGTWPVDHWCSGAGNSDGCVAGAFCHYGACREVCDFWSSDPGCPEDRECTSDGACVPSGDPAAFGEDCATESDFCAQDDAKLLGECITYNGAYQCMQVCIADAPEDCAPDTTCKLLCETCSDGYCVPTE